MKGRKKKIDEYMKEKRKNRWIHEKKKTEQKIDECTKEKKKERKKENNVCDKFC